jgi:hypothetical protein
MIASFNVIKRRTTRTRKDFIQIVSESVIRKYCARLPLEQTHEFRRARAFTQRSECGRVKQDAQLPGERSFRALRSIVRQYFGHLISLEEEPAARVLTSRRYLPRRCPGRPVAFAGFIKFSIDRADRIMRFQAQKINEESLQTSRSQDDQ